MIGARWDRTWPALVVFAGVQALGSPAAPASSPPQSTGEKTVYVSALDANRLPVLGLTRDAWGVKEDGTDRAVVDVVPATDPLDVVLVIDTSLNSLSSTSALRAGLNAFATAAFSGPAPVTISVMDVAVNDVIVGDRLQSLGEVSKILSRTVADRAGSTVLLDGLQQAARRLGASPTKRRAIVLVNIDGVPDLSSVQPEATVRAIVASGASLWATTYGVGASVIGGAASVSNTDTSPTLTIGGVAASLEAILSNVPAATGGLRTHLSVATALSSALTRIGNTIVGQYALTYTRPDGPMPRMLELGLSDTKLSILYATTPIR